jgi:hypothetical protein
MSEEKKFEDLTTEECKDLKIVFAPGCFDHFEGTQEELNELMAEITQMVKSGEILEKSTPVDELDDDELEFIENLVNQGASGTRSLQ